MSRLPLRARLTAAFIVVMAVLLVGAGAFVHHRQAADLDRSIDANLRARAQELAALLDTTGGNLEPVRRRLVRRAGDVGQVIDARGKTFELSSTAPRGPLLTASQLATARHRELSFVAPPASGRGAPVRVYARAHAVEEHHLVLVVASSLAARDATLAGLTRELLLGGSGALLIAALSGYAVARAALRPVEAMRARAFSISDLQSGERLPEPRAHDEVGRLAITLNGMLSRLEQVLARERAFVADASHELRTPLTVLRTELELALSQPRTAGELRAAIRSAHEETEHLGRLADDLLLLAQSDSDQLATAHHPVDVSDLLARARDQAMSRATAEGRRIEVATDEAPVVAGRPEALQRAVGNLVDNALRHGRGTVTVSARRHDGQVDIEIDDQGTDLDPAFAAHAFDRFARGPDAGSRPGSGLGLAIVLAVARAHHGDAGITPLREAGGTRAWMSLPLDGHRAGSTPDSTM